MPYWQTPCRIQDQLTSTYLPSLREQISRISVLQFTNLVNFPLHSLNFTLPSDNVVLRSTDPPLRDLGGYFFFLQV